MADIYSWQQSIWQRFLLAKQQNKLAHALILSGPDGLGKNDFSWHMAKAVLCLSPDADGQYCGRCHSCQVFDAESHPDHLLIEPAEQGKQIKIEQIRDLKQKQQLTPTISNWKTVIISPASSMNVNANNSLLKLLEEPEANTLIILITSKPQVMPITVKSRCQTFHFITPESEAANSWLEENCPNFSRSPATDKLLALCNGAPLAVAKMLETGLDQQVEQLNHDIETLFQHPINAIEYASNWLNYDLSLLMQQLYMTVYERVISNYNNDKKQLGNEPRPQEWKIVDCIVDTTKLISSQNNLNKQLLLESFLVELSEVIHKKFK